MIKRAKPTMLRDLAPSGKREVHKTEQEETKVGQKTISDGNRSSDGEGAYTEFENLNLQDACPMLRHKVEEQKQSNTATELPAFLAKSQGVSHQ